MQKYFLLMMLLLFSCRGKQKQAAPDSLPAPTVKIHLKKHTPEPLPKPEEFFVDSTHVGRKNHNKFELAKYSSKDSSMYVIIKFYAKQSHKWSIRNEYRFPKDDFLGCDPQIADFNHDKLNDVTYISAVAARAVNEVRKLFIYDKQNDSLIYVKNSEDYPGMSYNEELDCIDALLVSGCWETAFVKLKQDSLHEFARVSQCDSMIVTIFDQHGRTKTTSRRKNIYW